MTFNDKAVGIIGPVVDSLGLQRVPAPIPAPDIVAWLGPSLFVVVFRESREREVILEFGRPIDGDIPRAESDHQWFWLSELLQLRDEPQVPISAEGGDVSRPLDAYAEVLRRLGDELVIGRDELYDHLTAARKEREAQINERPPT